MADVKVRRAVVAARATALPSWTTRSLIWEGIPTTLRMPRSPGGWSEKPKAARCYVATMQWTFLAGCLLWTKLSMITIRLSSASLLSSAAAAFVRRRAAPWRASRKCTTCRFRGSDSTTQIRGFVVQTNCPTPTRSLTILTPWLSWLGRRTRSSRAIHCTASPLWPSPRSNPCWLSMRTSLGRKRSRLERSSACCYVVPARPRPPPTRRRCPRADEQFGL
mmetsp:Transcript_52323/g.136769  ORF Transcript_52323/g.136769 Transcript_52323/m.136769 type:complete len:220 (-) Transcript_52323:332-991(-)